MKTIVNLTNKLIVLTILLLSSCTTSNKVVCPSFGKSTGSKTRNYTIGIRHFTFNNPFTLKKDHSTKQKRKSPDPSYTDIEFAAEEPMESDLIASNEGILPADSFPSNSNSMQPVKRPHNIIENDRKSSLYKPQVATEVAKPIPHTFFEKKYAENQQEAPLVHEKSKRKKAVIKGVAIILLAVLAGIFIPLLGTTTASIGLVAMLIYILLNVGVLLVPNPIAFTALIQPIFVVPQILAEVLFALWMLLKGGKKVLN